MKVCKDVKKEFGNEYHTVTRIGLHIKSNSLTFNMNVCILLKFVVCGLLYIDIRNGIDSRNQQNLPA